MKINEYQLSSRQIQEVVLVLNLSVAQIELSLSEGDDSVDTLIDSFRVMQQEIELVYSLASKLERKEDSQAHLSIDLFDLTSKASELSKRMNRAIIAFQFYDRLSQRLIHVSHCLSGLSEIVGHEMMVEDDISWQKFKNQVYACLSMNEEQELFELVFEQKVSSEDAIEIMKKRMIEKKVQNDSRHDSLDDLLELF